MKRALLIVSLCLLPALAQAQLLPQSGSLTAASSATPCPAISCVTGLVGINPAVSIQVSGTYSGTITFEVAGGDDTTYVAALMTNATTGATGTTTTSTGVFAITNAGYVRIRARMSSFGSGTAVIAIQPAYGAAGVGGGVITGTVTANINNPSAVNAANQAVVQAAPSTTAVLTNIADTASSTALFASLTTRLGAQCVNDSTVALYINYGATASLTAFTELVQPGGSWVMLGTIYTGAINGIWASDQSGSARCTELRP